MTDIKNVIKELEAIGIHDVKEVVYNPSYEQLFEEETKPGLEGFEKGTLTTTGAVAVDTGIFTGRSPKDKYIVLDDTTKDTVWWTSDVAKNDNKPMTQETWSSLKGLVTKQLSGKRLFVVDGFCGASEQDRIAVRIVTEVAWQAHFVKNMFIRPTEEQLKTFKPDFVVMNGSKCTNPNWKEQLQRINQRKQMRTINAHQLAEILEKQGNSVEFISIPNKNHGGSIPDAIKHSLEQVQQ